MHADVHWLLTYPNLQAFGLKDHTGYDVFIAMVFQMEDVSALSGLFYGKQKC